MRENGTSTNVTDVEQCTSMAAESNTVASGPMASNMGRESTPSTGSTDAINSPSIARSSETSKAISLKELARRYSKLLLLRVHTLEGFRGKKSQLSISLADEYSIHFIKHQKMVTISNSKQNGISIYGNILGVPLV